MKRRSRRRDPAGLTAFGDAAGRWVDAVGLRAALCLGIGDPDRWRRLVGDDIANVCTPVGFADGVLEIRAVDELAETLVRYSEAAVVTVCNEMCGTAAVTRIRVVRGTFPDPT